MQYFSNKLEQNTKTVNSPYFFFLNDWLLQVTDIGRQIMCKHPHAWYMKWDQKPLSSISETLPLFVAYISVKYRVLVDYALHYVERHLCYN